MKLYNTLSGEIEEFIPQNKKLIKIYSCGVTTYDEIHFGHARQAIVFDVLRNYFEYLGYKVNYVRNFTDIDDKIIKKANEQNKSAKEISDYYIIETVNDLRHLKVRDATHQPKATEHIPDIILFIQKIIEKGFAYVANGEVLFDVDKFKSYGKLSRRRVDELISTEESPNKRRFYDFSLWKPARVNEPFWESPWGPGRPGWHIECSAMAKFYLGETLDIHGGGIDLVFPHHENEIAQSEAANGRPLANFWVHNGLITVEGEKMSKSLGNFYTVKDLLKEYTPDEIRFAVLIHNYSTPIDFNKSSFRVVRKRLYYFYKILAKIDEILAVNEDAPPVQTKPVPEIISDLEKRLRSSMDNNLNTSRVIAELEIVFSKFNEMLSGNDHRGILFALSVFRQQFNNITSVLKILDENPKDYINSLRSKMIAKWGILEEEIIAMLKERKIAKKNKDYKKSDEIRTTLLSKHISVHDKGDQTEWDVIFE